MDFVRSLFDADFMPHGHCFFWKPEVLWLTVIGDAFVFLAYIAIPMVLVYFVRRRKDFAFNWIFYMFAAFIVLCGLTHGMSIITLWNPIYRLEAVLKLMTGLVSIATAVMLVQLTPAALQYPSPHDLSEANARLKQANDELEARVEARTRELEIARDSATAANQAKSLFLAMMSHEIRTPLNGIIGTTSLMEAANPTPGQRELLGLMRLSGDALLSVINDVLDFARIEAGKLTMAQEPFLLRACIKEASDLAYPSASQKGLGLHVVIAEDVPEVLIGDSSRLRQVLLNLIANSVKFTEKGDIFCRVHLLKATEGRARIHFEVQDTGIGIEEEAQRLLFQAFTQAHALISRTHGGTGLGLAISKRLVEMMHGGISVESKLNEGSRFLFDIELPVGAMTAPHIDASTTLLGRLILIVDDRPLNRQILRHHVESLDCKCIEAEGATEALQILLERRNSDDPVEIALIDMEMPVMDGMMLARSIRSNLQMRRFPLILMSSSMDRKLGETEVGLVDAMLVKPITPQDLRRVIERALRQADIHEPKPITAGEQARRYKMKVLLAEDNLVNQTIGKRLLESLGCEVTLASNGIEAIAAVKGGEFAMVFMDCQMPRMDGYEATRSIREFEVLSARPHVPIIAITANAIPGNREACLEAGMNDFISKPIIYKMLADVLERWERAPEV